MDAQVDFLMTHDSLGSTEMHWIPFHGLPENLARVAQQGPRA